MQSRIDYLKAPPGAMKAMQAVQQYVNETGLEPRLLELVKLRVLHRHAHEGSESDGRD